MVGHNLLMYMQLFDRWGNLGNQGLEPVTIELTGYDFGFLSEGERVTGNIVLAQKILRKKLLV